MHSYRKLSADILSVVLASVLLCVAAMAQAPIEQSADAQATSAPPPPSAQTASSPSEDNAWHFNLSPYVWFPGVHGTVGALDHRASVHVSGSDVFSDFQGGIAGLVDIRKGRLVIPLDFLYAKVATTQGIPLNDLDQNQVRVASSEGIFNPKIGYRLVDGEHFKVDALFGPRIWHEGLSLTLRPSQANFSDSMNWVDAVAGGRFEIFFNPKIWITASGDAGGGAANLDYQALGTLHFQPKPLLGFFVGWRYVDVNYSKPSKGFLFDVAQSSPIIGLNFQFGGKPPVPPATSCSVSPTDVWAGDPVTATMSTQNFNPKHTITYGWSSSGAKVSGIGTTGSVDTAGLAPGTYTVKGTATDPKEKKNNVASCNASFTVKQPHPPTASCSASPDTVKPGDASRVIMNVSNPDNFPLTYAWSANAGRISGSETTASLDTTGATPGGAVTATGTVTDSRGLSATCNASVNVLAPPVTASEVSEIGECKFMDAKRPARVDNTCKAVLDDVAMRIQREPNGKFVIVGYTDEEESMTVTQVGAHRSVNMKYYLVNGEGGSQIDAARIDVRTSGTMKEKGAKVYFVPAGATLTEETVAVDETRVKGQPRTAPAPKKKPTPANPAE